MLDDLTKKRGRPLKQVENSQPNRSDGHALIDDSAMSQVPIITSYSIEPQKMSWVDRVDNIEETLEDLSEPNK